jgi:hypothetical protein
MGNLLCCFMQPVLISGQPNHFDCGKPFGRIRGWIAQRRQFAHSHQNLNVILREAQQSCRRANIKAGRQISCRPRRHRHLPHFVSHTFHQLQLMQFIRHNRPSSVETWLPEWSGKLGGEQRRAVRSRGV